MKSDPSTPIVITVTSYLPVPVGSGADIQINWLSATSAGTGALTVLATQSGVATASYPIGVLAPDGIAYLTHPCTLAGQVTITVQEDVITHHSTSTVALTGQSTFAVA